MSGEFAEHRQSQPARAAGDQDVLALDTGRLRGEGDVDLGRTGGRHRIAEEQSTYVKGEAEEEEDGRPSKHAEEIAAGSADCPGMCIWCSACTRVAQP